MYKMVIYCFQYKVSSDTYQEITCTSYYNEHSSAPKDIATLDYFRTCNSIDPEFWNITVLEKEITGRSRKNKILLK